MEDRQTLIHRILFFYFNNPSIENFSVTLDQESVAPRQSPCGMSRHTLGGKFDAVVRLLSVSVRPAKVDLRPSMSEAGHSLA